MLTGKRKDTSSGSKCETQMQFQPIQLTKALLSFYVNHCIISQKLFLVSYVGEKPWWPIQSPNRGRKKKAGDEGERDIRSGLLILDLKEGKL